MLKLLIEIKDWVCCDCLIYVVVLRVKMG